MEQTGPPYGPQRNDPHCKGEPNVVTKTKKPPSPPRGDTTTIEDLYGMVAPAIACEYVLGTYPNYQPCTNEAEWVMYISSHCTPDSSGTVRLICDPCLKRIEGGDVWKCIKCHAYAEIRDYIIKTERI